MHFLKKLRINYNMRNRGILIIIANISENMHWKPNRYFDYFQEFQKKIPKNFKC